MLRKSVKVKKKKLGEKDVVSMTFPASELETSYVVAEDDLSCEVFLKQETVKKLIKKLEKLVK